MAKNSYLEPEPDPYIVDALVQRYPVPGASPADRKAAAQILRDRGRTNDEIGIILRVQTGTVNKWNERSRRKDRGQRYA